MQSKTQWYGGLALGILPVLVAGGLAGAVANRVAFVPWALAVAALHAGLLRRGLGSGWSPRRLAAAAFAVWVVAAGSWIGLALVYGEPLARGARAFLPVGAKSLYVAPWPLAVVFTGLGLAVAAWARAAARR